MNVMHSSMEITDEYYSVLNDNELQNRIQSLGKQLEQASQEEKEFRQFQEFKRWQKQQRWRIIYIEQFLYNYLVFLVFLCWYLLIELILFLHFLLQFVIQQHQSERFLHIYSILK